MNKRAVSALIATVILIAATISIGLIVSSFTKTSAKKVTSEVQMISNKVECSDIELSVESFTATGLIIKNRGTRGITDIYLRLYKNTIESKTAKDYTWHENDTLGLEFTWIEKLMPGKKILTEDLNSDYPNINKLELIPIINIEGQIIGCEDQIRTWNK